MAMPVWERVGGGSDREHVDQRHQHEGEPEGAEGQHDRDEDHQHVAPHQDTEARGVVVLVEVAGTGDNAQDESDGVAIDRSPGFAEFIHGFGGYSSVMDIAMDWARGQQ